MKPAILAFIVFSLCSPLSSAGDKPLAEIVEMATAKYREVRPFGIPPVKCRRAKNHDWSQIAAVQGCGDD